MFIVMVAAIKCAKMANASTLNINRLANIPLPIVGIYNTVDATYFCDGRLSTPSLSDTLILWPGCSCSGYGTEG